jgi:arginine utilization protein RocB
MCEVGGWFVNSAKNLTDDIGNKIKALAIELTKTRSVVGTEGEIAVARKVFEYLSRLEYFQKNPRLLRLMPVKDDELGRLSVFAMIEGRQTEKTDTLLCIGHIDTVGIADYGGLQDMATEPSELKRNLASTTRFSEPAFSEIQSAEWLLGRGILDMKTGVAALMVMMEHFSQQPENLDGNLVECFLPWPIWLNCGRSSAGILSRQLTPIL